MPELEPTYISLGRWTRGWSGAGELPVTRTLSKSRWDVTIHSFYWVASGGYDTVAISSGAPLSIARCKLAISQRDQVQTELLTAVATYRTDDTAARTAGTALYLTLGRYVDGTKTPQAATGEHADRLASLQRETGVVPIEMYDVVAGDGSADWVGLSAAPSLDALSQCKVALAREAGLRTSSLWVFAEPDLRQLEHDVRSATERS